MRKYDDVSDDYADLQQILANQKRVIAQLTANVVQGTEDMINQRAINAALLEEINRLHEEITARDRLLRENLLAANRIVARTADLPVRYRHA